MDHTHTYPISYPKMPMPAWVANLPTLDLVAKVTGLFVILFLFITWKAIQSPFVRSYMNEGQKKYFSELVYALRWLVTFCVFSFLNGLWWFVVVRHAKTLWVLKVMVLGFLVGCEWSFNQFIKIAIWVMKSPLLVPKGVIWVLTERSAILTKHFPILIGNIAEVTWEIIKISCVLLWYLFPFFVVFCLIYYIGFLIF